LLACWSPRARAFQPALANPRSRLPTRGRAPTRWHAPAMRNPAALPPAPIGPRRRLRRRLRMPPSPRRAMPCIQARPSPRENPPARLAPPYVLGSAIKRRLTALAFSPAPDRAAQASFALLTVGDWAPRAAAVAAPARAASAGPPPQGCVGDPVGTCESPPPPQHLAWDRSQGRQGRRGASLSGMRFGRYV
jgi:hypothetical protein